jgi:hypothetical protein
VNIWSYASVVSLHLDVTTSEFNATLAGSTKWIPHQFCWVSLLNFLPTFQFHILHRPFIRVPSKFVICQLLNPAPYFTTLPFLLSLPNSISATPFALHLFIPKMFKNIKPISAICFLLFKSTLTGVQKLRMNLLMTRFYKHYIFGYSLFFLPADRLFLLRWYGEVWRFVRCVLYV